ncbi:hypothetical protein PanWU01x14_274810 [Parasponia andersonii]|uniref:RNase H type-1 domain-containing protein n=1 Tax=Parasponia andersonii TaxID=3476 RepID=A0A2P5B3D5_PARAD|nr:hypothetical protein PanWU01x14_274810 [Parasponia andersonii]
MKLSIGIAYVESWLFEYKFSNHLNVSSPITTLVMPGWFLPPVGKLKLNIDAAVDGANDVIGLGVVICNYLGFVRGVTTIKTTGHFSLHIAECMAKNVVSAIHSIEPLSVAGPLISDIIDNLSLVGNVSCSFVLEIRTELPIS